MSAENGNAKVEFQKALMKAKAKFKPLVKNKVNPHFKSEYADLAQLHDAVEEPLTENGFLIMAPIVEDEKGQAVKTRLMHIAGHEECSIFRLPTNGKPQEVGSAITYGARYGLQALLGIAPIEGDDDDGKAATEANAAPPKVYRVAKPATQPPKPQEPLVVPDSGPADDLEVATILTVVQKEGKSNKVGKDGVAKVIPWKLYIVKMGLGNGEEIDATTFDTDFGSVAADLQGGKLARVRLKEIMVKGEKKIGLDYIEPMPEE